MDDVLRISRASERRVALAKVTNAELERLRSLLRKAMPGASMVEIAPGEVIGLYQRPDEA